MSSTRQTASHSLSKNRRVTRRGTIGACAAASPAIFSSSRRVGHLLKINCGRYIAVAPDGSRFLVHSLSAGQLTIAIVSGRRRRQGRGAAR
jgi:hypothetical protein